MQATALLLTGALLGGTLLGGTLLGGAAAYGQPQSPDSNTAGPGTSNGQASVFEIIMPVEDINYVSEDLDGASQLDEAEDYAVLTLSADVNFAKDSAKLSTRANKILADAATKWKDKDITSIEITGHTDSVKGKVENNKLSRDRAAAVEKVLKKDFPDAKISSAGKGPSQPRAEEAGLEGKELEKARAMNRRVEVVVSFPKVD